MWKIDLVLSVSAVRSVSMFSHRILSNLRRGGRFLKIEICKVRPKEPAKKDAYKEPPKKYEGCLSAYIGNLCWDITEKELRKFFKGCKIDAIRFAENKETGEFRGFGHVDFADDESLEAAMKLDRSV